MKFWIGGLAKCATMTTVFANLIVNGKNEGVHAFVIRVRDSRNHKPLPGMTIGDCGEKFALHGVDNGWIRFNHVRIPYDALLDKISSIDEQGNYQSKYESQGKRFGMTMASLSYGRLAIVLKPCEQAIYGLIATLRYSLV